MLISYDLEEYMLPCLHKQVFGFDCPGCGLQRSVALLLEGNFVGAFYMYPAIYPIVAVLLFSALNIFIRIKNAYTIRITLILLMAFAMVANYIFKMSHFFH